MRIRREAFSFIFFGRKPKKEQNSRLRRSFPAPQCHTLFMLKT
jgi:hypothetical protein